METDLNLLFGILALQADLIDAGQFVEACTLWATRKSTPLAQLLVERGWILAADRAHVDYLLERKLHKHGGNARASLAAVPDDVKRSLAALDDPEVRRTLADLPGPGGSAAVTLDHVPGPPERYTLLRLHARGGLGQVWLARDDALGRQVALKEMRPDKAEDPATRARFLREARITGQLEHPGIIPVYELARQGNGRQPFYTMRFVKGRTLTAAARAYHQKRQAGQADALELLALLNAFVTVCHTVAYAHARGVIHRDLKGDNVALGDFGEVVVLDWGLARVTGYPEPELAAEAVNPAPEELLGTDLTVQGQALGTPAYMAPEQAAGRLDQISPATDVYGLGAILYEILTGEPPFAGSDTHEVLRRVREEEPVPPGRRCPDVPPALEAVCLRALAKRPEDRFAGAGQLAQQVQHWLAESAERQHADKQRARFFALSLDLMSIAGFDGYFKQLNPAWEKTLGWSLAELQARPWVDFVHPDDVARTVAEMGRIIAEGTCLLFENRYRCKDGSYRWLQWTAQEIVGQQVLYAIARDVTDRKQVEETLRASEERYRSVIAAMQDGIVLMDADGSIRACNASAERILGLSADQMRGRTPVDPRWGAVRPDGTPFPDEERPPVVTLRTGRPCTNVVLGVRKPDGTLSWLSVSSQPLFQSDGTTLAGVVTCFADITKHRRAEEALRQTTHELTQLQRRLRGS